MAPRIWLFCSSLAVAAMAAPVHARTLTETRQAQVDAASRAYAGASAAYSTGTGGLEAVYAWSVRWLNAERALFTAAAERRAAAGRHLERMLRLTVEVTRRVATGLSPVAEGDAAAFYVAEAEAWVSEAG